MVEVKGIMKPDSSEIKGQKTWQEVCWFAGRPLQANGVSYQGHLRGWESRPQGET